jgi:hypothetical protein
MIKYHPILFSTPMVQGLLEYRKTKTRRTKGLEKVNLNPNNWKFEAFGTNPDKENDKNLHAYFTVKGTETWMHLKCPCNVGDVLWVRETWKYSDDLKTPYWYKADFEKEYNQEYLDFIKGSWKPSIHMYKEACRIFLKVKSIRVERLQDISEEDAKAEGVIKEINEKWRNYLVPQTYWSCAKFSFETLWISINGKDSMNKNPFVWVYEFERIEKPLDFII